MLISDLSVRRPVFATVMSLLLFILGLGAITRLSLREFPDVDRPVVNVETRYRGASSDVVESRITQVIEDEISGIEGVERLNSSSRDERSQINVEFNLERDLDSAANDVRERLSRVAGRLPLEADPPQITKVDSGTDPIIWLNVASTQRNMLEITDYMERYLQDQFATLEGVASVRLNGARRYAMRVWLSRENLAARQLTVADVENSLLRENVEIPAGRLESREREFALRTDTNLRTEEDFRSLVVGRGPDGYLVRLGEVAEVRLASDDDRSIARSNGTIGLSMAIIPQSKANVLKTSALVKERLAQIQPSLPKDITVEINIDNGVYIEASLKNVVLGAVRDADPGARRHLPVPRNLPRHADSRCHDSGVHHRRRHRDVGARLLDQHPDDAGRGAGHRTGGGRRHRGARKHRAAYRRRRGRRVGLDERLAGNRLRRDRHHAGTHGGVRARVVHGRRYREVVRRVRCDGGGRGGFLGVRGAEPHAHDGVQIVYQRHAALAHGGWHRPAVPQSR